MKNERAIVSKFNISGEDVECCVASVLSSKILNISGSFIDINSKGIFEANIDASWHISLNKSDINMKNKRGIVIDPYFCLIQYNEHPVGLVGGDIGFFVSKEVEIEFLKACMDRIDIEESMAIS